MATFFMTKDAIFVVETFVKNKCMGIPIPIFLHFLFFKSYICFFILFLWKVRQVVIKELETRFLTHAI
jgi:hypothetical protein